MNKRVSRFSNILKPISGANYIDTMMADAKTASEKTDLTVEDILMADGARMASTERQQMVAPLDAGGVNKKIPVNFKIKPGDVVQGIVSVRPRVYAKLNINRPIKKTIEFVEVTKKHRGGKASIYKIVQFSRKKLVSESK